MTYKVVERKGWSYVEGDQGEPKPEWNGAWRYRWEAQEEADRLNGVETAEPPK